MLVQDAACGADAQAGGGGGVTAAAAVAGGAGGAVQDGDGAFVLAAGVDGVSGVVHRGATAVEPDRHGGPALVAARCSCGAATGQVDDGDVAVLLVDNVRPMGDLIDGHVDRATSCRGLCRHATAAHQCGGVARQRVDERHRTGGVTPRDRVPRRDEQRSGAGVEGSSQGGTFQVDHRVLWATADEAVLRCRCWCPGW